MPAQNRQRSDDMRRYCCHWRRKTLRPQSPALRPTPVSPALGWRSLTAQLTAPTHTKTLPTLENTTSAETISAAMSSTPIRMAAAGHTQRRQSANHPNRQDDRTNEKARRDGTQQGSVRMPTIWRQAGSPTPPRPAPRADRPAVRCRPWPPTRTHRSRLAAAAPTGSGRTSRHRRGEQQQPGKEERESRRESIYVPNASGLVGRR